MREMEKTVLFDALIAQLKGRVEASRAASLDAASYATDSEAKADSKWDTQGLEASYLAAGQASHAKETARALRRLEGSRSELLRARRVVEIGALIKIDFGGGVEWYFIASDGGGEVVRIEDEKFTVLTPQSPLFALLKGRVAGTQFSLPNGARVHLHSIA